MYVYITFITEEDNYILIFMFVCGSNRVFCGISIFKGAKDIVESKKLRKLWEICVFYFFLNFELYNSI